MNSSDELRVQPVKRYRTPKYPSHLDPDPTLHPDPVPYPISGKAVSVLASASLLLSTACRPPAQSAGNAEQTASSNLTTDVSTSTVFEFPDDHKMHDGSNENADDADEVPNFGQRLRDYEEQLGVDYDKERQQMVKHLFSDNKSSNNEFQLPSDVREGTLRKRLIESADGNPLCVAVSGLPHQTSPYGTGVPDRVDGDLARRVIERVFASAGYNLRPNVPYDNDGVAFVVDGYDAQNRVGFVVGDWSNLDDDAIVSWMSSRRTARGDNSSEVEWWAALAESKVMGINDGEKQRFANDIATAKRLADPAKAKAALKAIIDRMSKRYLSYKEIQSLERKASQGKEFIAVISTFDNRFEIPWVVRVPSSEEAAIQEQIDTEIRERGEAGEDIAVEEYVDRIRNWREKRLAELKAKTVMQSLETAAREYIEWAKTQGLE
ncbi:hypothetical protein SH528x_004808 [Novipirellula sp. SH528]|uniref:hypothetical protein n=1 Tax=Novipirellula sp. SH528 TaxID=3454466 RepID=UPI003FA0139F